MKLIVENKSNANKEYVDLFYSEVEKLDARIKQIIFELNFKIVLTNKFSDVQECLELKERYKEDYSVEKQDSLIRGLDSSIIKSICVFSNTTTTQNLGCILYHEIGHLIDYFYDYDNPYLSTKQEFIDAYKKDLTDNWDKISQDKRFRLIHYVQDSTPNNLSNIAIMETFAMSFAKFNGYDDDIDVMGLYFPTCVKVCGKLVEEFFNELKK